MSTHDNLKLIVFESAKDLGNKIDKHLVEMYHLDKNKHSFILPIRESFFDDGHFKVEILDSVRGKDIFMLTDVGNYSIEYKMRGLINHTSPNDLMFELKDGIGACDCHAKSINIVMPLLYQGRQHRRNTRENLSCGMTLHELDNMSKVRSFLKFDAHDQGVEHAIHNMEFDNFIPTNVILEELINDLSIDELKNIVFIAPDNGATGRRNIYLNSFNSPYIHKESGSFIKRRDYNRVVDGKNPIISHDYSGSSNIEGFTAIIPDDMISSGSSMFDVIDELKKRGVLHIYIVVTYALFTKGIDKFNEYYDKGMFDGIYTSNLSYIPEEYKKASWLHVCDSSKLVADVIYNIHNDLSISCFIHDKSEPGRMLDEKFEEYTRKLKMR